MHQSEDINVVNDLIEVTIDSAEGYRLAAEKADQPTFRQMFAARAIERAELASRLQQFVRGLGGNPTDSGSLTAGAHRVLVSLHATVTGGDVEAIVKDVEAGEDHIKSKFETACENTTLSPETRDLLLDGKRIVLDGHDQMRDLKHAMARGEKAG